MNIVNPKTIVKGYLTLFSSHLLHNNNVYIVMIGILNNKINSLMKKKIEALREAQKNILYGEFQWNNPDKCVVGHLVKVLWPEMPRLHGPSMHYSRWSDCFIKNNDQAGDALREAGFTPEEIDYLEFGCMDWGSGEYPGSFQARNHIQSLIDKFRQEDYAEVL